MTTVIHKMDFSRLGRAEEAVKRELPPLMADVIRTEVSPYVQFVTAALNSSAYVNEAAIRQGKIKWGGTTNSDSGKSTTAYASAQFSRYPNKTRTHHPKATMEWTKKAQAERGRAWKEIAQAQARAIARRTT